MAIVPHDVSKITVPPANGGLGGFVYCFEPGFAGSAWSQPSLPVWSGPAAAVVVGEDASVEPADEEPDEEEPHAATTIASARPAAALARRLIATSPRRVGASGT